MRDLTIKDAQKIVDDWINQFEEGYWPPLSMLASLMEEVGELARELNAILGIKRRKKGELEGNLGLEMADVFFSLICLANYYDIDLESEFKEAIKKYSVRDSDRWKRKRVEG